MDSLVAYLVAAMIGWVPLHVHAPAESIEEARMRYESIARDAVAVAFDDSEAPLFSGPEGRTQTAFLMLSVASYESGYRSQGRRRPRALGDHGHSYCLMQVRVGTGVTREGWTGHDLVSNRQLVLSRRAPYPAKLVRRLPRAGRRRPLERLRVGALLRRRRDLADAREPRARVAGGARSAEGDGGFDLHEPPPEPREAEG